MSLFSLLCLRWAKKQKTAVTSLPSRSSLSILLQLPSVLPSVFSRMCEVIGFIVQLVRSVSHPTSWITGILIISMKTRLLFPAKHSSKPVALTKTLPQWARTMVRTLQTSVLQINCCGFIYIFGDKLKSKFNLSGIIFIVIEFKLFKN